MIKNERPDNYEIAHALAVAGELRVLIGKLKRRLREEAHLGNLSLSQTSALSHLEREGPATVTTLARAQAMRPQSMGATVSSLEEAGLVSGVPDPNDGRQTIWSLTDACREMIKVSRAAGEDWLFRSIRTKFTPVEQEALATGVELLKRLVDS